MGNKRIEIPNEIYDLALQTLLAKTGAQPKRVRKADVTEILIDWLNVATASYRSDYYTSAPKAAKKADDALCLYIVEMKLMKGKPVTVESLNRGTNYTPETIIATLHRLNLLPLVIAQRDDLLNIHMVNIGLRDYPKMTRQINDGDYDEQLAEINEILGA